MGYFNALTEQFFKVDDHGTELFFPNGTWGSGYIIPNEETSLSLRRFVRTTEIVGIVGAIAVELTLGWTAVWIFLILGLTIYLFVRRSLLTNLERSEEKLSTYEAQESKVQHLNLFFLVFLAIFAVLMIAMALALIFLGEQYLLSGILLVFFVYGLHSSVEMILIKLNEKEDL